ncbi:MAG: RNA polymerase sigma factor [bacterium]
MTEERFIALLKNQDQKAFGKLVDDYEKLIFNRCLSFVPNTEDAADITQEVFVEIYKSINSFKGNAKLTTWIYRISTTKCLEFIRKRNTKKRFAFLKSISGEYDAIDAKSYFTKIDHPGVLLEQKELTETLFLAIDKLPDSQKVVFTLNKIDGLSYQEVSEITKKSVSSVESILFRAKKNLQKILENYYKTNF